MCLMCTGGESGKGLMTFELGLFCTGVFYRTWRVHFDTKIRIFDTVAQQQSTTRATQSLIDTGLTSILLYCAFRAIRYTTVENSQVGHVENSASTWDNRS